MDEVTARSLHFFVCLLVMTNKFVPAKIFSPRVLTDSSFCGILYIDGRKQKKVRTNGGRPLFYDGGSGCPGDQMFNHKKVKKS